MSAHLHPIAPLRLDRSLKLAAGLRYCWPLVAGTGLHDLVTGKSLTFSGTHNYVFQPHPILGNVLHLPSGSSIFSMLLSGLADLPAPWTFHFWWHRIDSSASVAVITSHAADNTGLRGEQYNLTNNLGLTYGGTDANFGLSAPTTRAVPITVTQRSGGDATLWLDRFGESRGTATLASSGVALSLSHLGNYAPINQFPLYGWWGHLFVWDRVLSEAEVHLLHHPQTRWQLYLAAQRPVIGRASAATLTPGPFLQITSPLARRPGTISRGVSAPVYVPDVTDPPPTPHAATVRLPDQALQRARPPTPHDLGGIGPIDVPGVQVAFLAGQSVGPDRDRRLPRSVEFPAYTSPIALEGVQVPAKSWESTGPDWLRRASGVRPFGTGWTGPLRLADVTVLAPDLSWRGLGPDWLRRARSTPEFSAVAAPIEIPGVIVPFLAGRSDGPDWLRRARQLTPADLGWAGPIYLADVTTPTPDLAWSARYRDRYVPRLPHPAWGSIVADPTTPAVAFDTVWYPSLPDHLLRRAWAVAVWASRTTGAAGLLAVGPGFSAATPLSWRVIQYTALVAPYVIAAAVPDLTASSIPDLIRRLDATRHRHAQDGPIEPPVVVPAPDLAVVVGETTRRAASFFTRALPLTAPIEPPPAVAPTIGWSVHADPHPRRPLSYRWPFFTMPRNLPVNPAVPAPDRGDWAFGGLPPRTARAVPDRLWWVGPLRVADVTASAPDLAWQGRYPDQLWGRRGPAEGASVLSWAAVIPFLDPSRFGWRGVGPDWIARRILAAPSHPADFLLSPTPFPIPDLAWGGSFPDRVAPWPTWRRESWSFDPFPLPNAASPDLAWAGIYPDRFPASPPRRHPAVILRPEREIATIPDLVTLVVAPTQIVRAVLPIAARTQTLSRLFIDIPDIRLDWGGLDMDWAQRKKVPVPSQRYWVAEGERAISPVDWWGSRPDQTRLAPARPVRTGLAGDPPRGTSLSVAEQLRWQPQGPRVQLIDRWVPADSVLVLPPEIPAAGIPCVELGEGTLTTPQLLAPTAGSPQLLDPTCGSPVLLSGEVC